MYGEEDAESFKYRTSMYEEQIKEEREKGRRSVMTEINET